ncbi:unnamed protein product [Mytilus coruscus]|uniref:RNase H type-1 domain-containing protein n=1 Tax=Mytilus coruscus TaxID=42192 RepID=A0A6J8C3I2_MYTCO|nr:unnamed protein product [Mytilus coruscus]
MIIPETKERSLYLCRTAESNSDRRTIDVPTDVLRNPPVEERSTCSDTIAATTGSLQVGSDGDNNMAAIINSFSEVSIYGTMCVRSSTDPFLELDPIVVAALLWGHLWSCKILFWCDNEASVAIVRKGRSRCLEIKKLMRQLTWCAAEYNFHFSAKHVPGHKNKISDALSRLQITRFQTQAELHPHTCLGVSEVICGLDQHSQQIMVQCSRREDKSCL